MFDIDLFQPVTILSEELTPVDLWQGLNGNAKAWQELIFNPENTEVCARIDGSDRQFISYLQNFPASRWLMMCHGTGWTVYGAVALSWCAGAKLEDVWSGWEASDFPLRPEPASERPARFLNPALLPAVVTGSNPEQNTAVTAGATTPRSLRALTEAAENRPLPLCAMIAANDLPIIFDLPADMLSKASPQIASFLKSRMERQGVTGATEQALIEAWNQRVKDTQYDVWSETAEETNNSD